MNGPWRQNHLVPRSGAYDRLRTLLKPSDMATVQNRPQGVFSPHVGSRSADGPPVFFGIDVQVPGP